MLLTLLFSPVTEEYKNANTSLCLSDMGAGFVRIIFLTL